jgi:hypothetical protein
MVILTMITAGKFDHLFHIGHLMNNFINAMVVAVLLTMATRNIKWIKKESWMEEVSEHLKTPIDWFVNYVWESVLALDVDLVDVDKEPAPEFDEKQNEPTVKEIVEKLSNTFYLNDTHVLNP